MPNKVADTSRRSLETLGRVAIQATRMELSFRSPSKKIETRG